MSLRLLGYGMAVFLFMVFVVPTVEAADRRTCPDIHCIMKKRRLVPEGMECIYRCADRSRYQIIQQPKHKCPTRIFKKNKSCD